MKKQRASLEEVKNGVASLMGTDVRVSVNKGRKKIVRYDGRVESVYPSVFTLTIYGDDFLDKLSCSYCDVICGDIVLKPKS